ncbi:methylated-DNA--[protein]-cysteine S-methyltransferase [Acidovorax sp. sic0104]|uniref:methylated-DNA--[protein]-cysteine S-methyltransferase n=1 Tax=Acidovorax sp. sic0104 TaxID=2854784 RepID=UPI001C496F5D|nr:methylated-DNA--[protein]-cysteine S-methyltransferase [Acidovorax sp. sic0104]MBV7540619.1 methylated-DNA--[protein]-cysteine S-methyltransferase [Acidovorax sp. sic0104]
MTAEHNATAAPQGGACSACGYALFATTIGHCGIAWQGALLVGVQLPEDAGEAATRARMQRRFPQLSECAMPSAVGGWAARVAATLEGVHDDLLDVPLATEGVPPFNARVYALARRIPPGKTMTYGEMAAALGEPGAARAVGQALGHNPFAPVVPCHRILAANGRTGGFSAGGGAATKMRMLDIEGAFAHHTLALFAPRS